MIRVESDTSAEWDGRTGWAALGDEAVKAAVAASVHRGLLDSGITVEVSIKFASDAEVRALNAAYRNRDAATNVLSFPMFEGELIGSVGRADGGEALLGDVVLAKGVCAAEAAEKGVPVRTHVAHLIVHGTLHLLGYDHERGDEEAEAMEETERRALAAVGIADPYQLTEVQT